MKFVIEKTFGNEPDSSLVQTVTAHFYHCYDKPECPLWFLYALKLLAHLSHTFIGYQLTGKTVISCATATMT